MRTQEFFERVWGSDQGTRIIATSIPGKDATFQNFGFDNNEGAAAFAAAEDAKGKNAYFGVHLFEGEGRKASNAIGCRALYLDIDCGEGKQYGDQASALEAVKRFLEVTELPQPTIVDSGNGWHLYWLLTEMLEPAMWSTFARQIDTLCKNQGLKADKVTTDRARVLRCPGTANRKDPNDGDGKRCEILLQGKVHDPAEIKAILDKHTPSLPTENTSEINNSFMAGLYGDPEFSKGAAKLCLEFLRPERLNDYAEWTTVGFALWNAFGGSSEGLLLWDEASKRSNKYEPGVCSEKWQTMSERPDGDRANVGSLHYRALEDGGDAFEAAWKQYHGEKQVEMLVARVDSVEMTDYGNAQRLVALHGQDIRYDYARKLWYAWTGTHWKENAEAEVIRFAKATVKTIYIEAGKTESEVRRKELAKWAKASESAKHIHAMIKLAESEDEIQATISDFDRHPNLLNVANGIVNLRTRRLGSHDRSMMLTHCLAIPYDPAVRCPIFDAFMDRIFAGNTDLINYVLKALGYSLTGETSEQVFFICYGEGANGKSTLIETVQHIFGGIAGTVRTDALMQSKFGGSSGHNEDIASLCGKRFVSAAETESGQHLAESCIKQVTGGDTISASRKYGRLFQFNPFFKLFLAANHKPQISGTDEGIWRRIRLLPFSVRIPEADRDPKLKEKLRSEAVGILAKLIESAANWYQHGLGSEPDVISATTAYRSEQDSVAGFVSECFDVGEDFVEEVSTVNFEYVDYCRAYGLQQLNQKQFPAEMKRLGFFTERRTIRNSSQRVYLKLRRKGSGFANLDTKPQGLVHVLSHLQSTN